MKLGKANAAVFAALITVGAGAEAAQVLSMTGSGTFAGGGAGPFAWSGTLTMDVNSGASFNSMIPNAFIYSGGAVSIGSLGTGLNADDAAPGTVDFSNLAITWAFAPGQIFPITNQAMTVNSLSGGNFDIAWTGSSAIGSTAWTMVGQYSAVPLPAAAWLMGGALMGLLGFGRRKVA